MSALVLTARMHIIDIVVMPHGLAVEGRDSASAS